MALFEDAILTILKHEGGFINHINDPGGATNYGVSLKFLKSIGILANYDFDNDGDIDVDDIKSLSVEAAKEIYRTHWWDKYKYEQINNQAIATKLLDMSVNMGHKQAVKLLQSACLQLMSNKNLKVDGILGVKTLALVNQLSSLRLIECMRSECAKFYDTLILKNPKLKVFEKGWMKRAYS